MAAHPGLIKSSKFLRVQRDVALPAPHVVGHLVCMWMTTHESGDARLGSEDDVELFAQWNGERGRLFTALRDAGGKGRTGFIELAPGSEDQWQVHDWEDHLPGWVRDRERKRRERVAVRDVSWTSPGRVPDKSGQKPPASDTIPNHTTPTNSASQSVRDKQGAELFAVSERPSTSPESRSGEHPAVVSYWCDGWRKKYGQKFPFEGGKHGAHISRLLKHFDGDGEKARTVIDRYLANDEEFFAGHRLELMISQLAKFIISPVSKGAKNGNRSPYLAGGYRPGECPEASKAGDLAALAARGRPS